MPTPETVRYLGADPAPVIMTPMTFDQAAKDLNDKMGGLLTQGDSWQSSNVTGAMSSAVQAYQAAGQAGATQVGPEIDAAGNPGVTQKYTQQAWTLNAALAAVNATDTATASDAALAAQYAKQMYALYQQAIGIGGGTAGEMPWNTVLVWGLGIGTLAGLGIFLYDSKSRHGRKRRR